MKNQFSRTNFKARRAIVNFGLLTVTFAAFLLLAGSAEMQPPNDVEQFDSPQIEQTDALGKLAFMRRTYTFSSIFTNLLVFNLDGTGGGLVPTGEFSFPMQPVWSPDGTRIAYSGSGGDILAINVTSNSIVNLTATPQGESNPSWAATGKIAYERENRIWMMNDDGSNQAIFSAVSQPSPTAPAWSLDGTKLAFVSGGDVFVINVDGTGEQRVTTSGAAAQNNPAFAPDGSRIVFQKGAQGIFVISLDGTNEVNLSNGDDRAGLVAGRHENRFRPQRHCSQRHLFHGRKRREPNQNRGGQPEVERI